MQGYLQDETEKADKRDSNGAVIYKTAWDQLYCFKNDSKVMHR